MERSRYLVEFESYLKCLKNTNIETIQSDDLISIIKYPEHPDYFNSKNEREEFWKQSHEFISIIMEHTRKAQMYSSSNVENILEVRKVLNAVLQNELSHHLDCGHYMYNILDGSRKVDMVNGHGSLTKVTHPDALANKAKNFLLYTQEIKNTFSYQIDPTKKVHPFYQFIDSEKPYKEYSTASINSILDACSLSEYEKDHNKLRSKTSNQIAVEDLAFCGIQAALKKIKNTNGLFVDNKKYPMPEEDMYYGFSTCYDRNKDEPDPNTTYILGCKLGAIMEEIKRIASESQDKDATLPSIEKSYPCAKYSTTNNYQINSTFGHIEREIYECHATKEKWSPGESNTPYNPYVWSTDGRVAVCHTGTGWKNREFLGKLVLFPKDPKANSKSSALFHQFWDTPSEVYCDGADGNNMAYIFADRRIKGFDASFLENNDYNDNYNNYFSWSRNSQRESQHLKMKYVFYAPFVKKAKTMNNKWHSGPKMFRVGSKLHLFRYGMIKEWDLNTVSEHDGVTRYIGMGSCDGNKTEKYQAEKIIDLSNGGTWMDESGGAEASRGVNATNTYEARQDLFVPKCIGYLPENKMIWTYGKPDGPHGKAILLDSELRQYGSLIGHTNMHISVNQRPMFSDNRTLATCDIASAKVWDLRTQYPVITLTGQKANPLCATPIDSEGIPFLSVSTGNGYGIQMWDMRQRQLLYTLPSSGKNVYNAESKRLICGDGSLYRFGEVDDFRETYPDKINFYRKCEWEHLHDQQSKDKGNCVIC